VTAEGERTTARRALRVAAWALALAWLVLTAYPLIWVIVTAFKTRAEYSGNLWGLPSSPTFGNFTDALGKDLSFTRFYLNGLVVTVTAVVVTTFAGALAGYSLARLRFRGSGLVLGAFVLGLVVPIHATLIPLHRMETAAGLGDTLLGLACPYVAFSLPVAVVLFRGFFASLPVEIEEAARLDGAGRLRIVFQIAMPLSRPAVATVVIFTGVTLWNEYAFALALLESPANYTLPLGLDRFSSAYAVNVPLTCAAIVMGLAPVIAVYLLAERHITRGLAAGAIR